MSNPEWLKDRMVEHHVDMQRQHLHYWWGELPCAHYLWPTQGSKMSSGMDIQGKMVAESDAVGLVKGSSKGKHLQMKKKGVFYNYNFFLFQSKEDTKEHAS